MTLRIASWNIEQRLSRYTKSGRGCPEFIINSIKQLNADVIFLPEAFDSKIPIEKTITAKLASMGYIFYDVPYEEGGPIRPDYPDLSPNLRIMSRIPISKFKKFRLGKLRNALSCSVIDPQTQKEIRILGIHLDDRSEALRQSELPSLIAQINSSNLPTVMVGDYNAMSGTTKKAKIINSKFIRLLEKLILNQEIRSYAIRASDMAIGSTLRSLEQNTRLRDVDDKHRPTTTPKLRTVNWLPSIRLIDIDHMLVSPDILVENFTIMGYDGGSDHRAISAFISVK